MESPRMLSRRVVLLASASAAAIAAASPIHARWFRLQAAGIVSDVQRVARDAYVFVYPLVLMDITRQQMTAVPAASPGVMKAPVNQFTHVGGFPDATFRSVVSPNVDTLYSVAWLDLREELMVLSLPAPPAAFNLMVRLYWPESAVLDGTWGPPAVTQVG